MAEPVALPDPLDSGTDVAAVVSSDVELLEALRYGRYARIELAGHVRLGRAWRQLREPIRLRGNVTVMGAALPQLSMAPLLDFGFVKVGVILFIYSIFVYRRIALPSFRPAKTFV